MTYRKLKSLIIFPLVLYVSGTVLAQQDTLRYQSEPVIVTASRLSQDFLSTPRYVAVFDSAEIAALPGESVQSILQYATGTDLRQRGPSGVQADLSIRGSTFEQTVVMVDGTKLSAPQTGHHRMSIPVPREEIERIEIMHGDGTSLYGPNAFGGVVNIITKKKGKKPTFKTSLGGGSHGFNNVEVSAGMPVSNSYHRVHVSRQASDGYRYNTDFRITNAMYQGEFTNTVAPINIFAGYTNKDFGANDFYTRQFSDQHEHVETALAKVSSHIDVGGLQAQPSVYFRNNYDDFILDNTRPDWYRNKHLTHVYGGELMLKKTHRFGDTVLGGEFAGERISSSNLGDHERRRGGIVIEHRMNLLKGLELDIRDYTYYHEEYGWESWPSISLQYRVRPRSSVYVNYGQAYRVPTFTDLYYSSPANLGNPNLRPERSRSYEAGYKWLQASLYGSAALFYRDGYNLIDWTRSSPDDPWQVQNLGDVDTYGGEAEIKIFPENGHLWRFPAEQVSLKYAYVQMITGDVPAESKYVLNYVRHNLQAGVLMPLPLNLRQQWIAMYFDRKDVAAYTLLDVNTMYRIARYQFSLQILNFLDTQYEEIPGIPMPGREYRIGVAMRFG